MSKYTSLKVVIVWLTELSDIIKSYQLSRVFYHFITPSYLLREEKLSRYNLLTDNCHIKWYQNINFS